MSIDTIWYTRCPVPTAFSIAVREGWLDDELSADGITVQSLAVSRDRSVRQSHFEQTQPNFFRQGGNIPPIVSRSRGADVRLIGLSWTDTYEPVLTLPGSGIRTAADLRGRRLSLPRRVGDSIDFWRATAIRGYERALQTAGLSSEDVELVEVAIDRSFVDDATESTAERATLWDTPYMLGFQREEALALVRGEVDAVFSQGAIATNLQAFLGAETVLDVGSLPGRDRRVNNDVPLALTVTGELLDERPDIVARVLARVLRAGEWAIEHVEEARRIVGAEVGLAEELVDRAYSSRFARQLAVDLSEEALTGLASQTELLGDHGFLAAEVDLEAFVDHAPLQEARRLLEQGSGALAVSV